MSFLNELLKNQIRGMLITRDGLNYIKLDEWQWDNGNGQKVTAEICIAQDQINGTYGWDQHVVVDVKAIISVKASGT